jgi:transcriptional regulator GlxA family with amidase domain
MNDSVDQLAQGTIPFQATVPQLSRSQLTMMTLASQSDYQPAKMARLCRLSLRQLERIFKVESGCTPRQWLRMQRLNSALLLLRTAQSVKQVGYSLAYAQMPQFCREFKTRFGITPNQFRQSQAGTQDRMLTAHLGEQRDIGSGHPLRRLIESKHLVSNVSS